MPRPVLDYAPPPRPLTERAWKAVTAFAKMQISSTASAAVCWGLGCLLTLHLVSESGVAWRQTLPYYVHTALVWVATLSLLSVAIYAFLRLLLWERKWQRALLLITAGLPLAILCCVIQIKSCPHTQWLQVMGSSYPLGKGC